MGGMYEPNLAPHISGRLKYNSSILTRLEVLEVEMRKLVHILDGSLVAERGNHYHCLSLGISGVDLQCATDSRGRKSHAIRLQSCQIQGGSKEGIQTRTEPEVLMEGDSCCRVLGNCST